MRSATIKTQNTKPQQQDAIRDAPKEPLTENIVCKKRKPKGFYLKMKDEELVLHAQKIVDENGLFRPMDLRQKDCGLYHAIHKRKLMPMLIFKGRKRSRPNGFFTRMKDKELIEYTKLCMQKYQISEKTQLSRHDCSLYATLCRKKLLDQVGFVVKRRNWVSMGDKELIIETEKIMKVHGIYSSWELGTVDAGLYSTLVHRKILHRIKFREKHRKWIKMSDEKLLCFTDVFVKIKQIASKSQLSEADSSLYQTLLKRDLLSRVHFINTRKEQRKWRSMSNKKLIAYGKKFLEDESISNRSILEKSDPGLYNVLWRRGLVDKVFNGIDSARKQATESRTLVGLSQAALAMEKFGEGEKG